MTPEEFDGLDPAAQAAAIDHHNEEVRQWVVTCRKCGFRMIGTLRELRTMKCPVCTENSNG